MEEKIEKLILTVTDKETATVLKNDMALAGVERKMMKIRANKKDGTFVLTINEANDNLPAIIRMFNGPEYNLSFEEIQDLLHIQILINEPNEV